MKKKKLQNLLTSAKFILTDEQFKKLETFISNDDFTGIRLYLDMLLDESEMLLSYNPDDSSLLHDCKTLDHLQNLVIDLIVNEIDNERRKQIREVTN